MEYVLIVESVVLLFFLCNLIKALTDKITQVPKEKPFKINLTKSKPYKETKEERINRILLENINNFGSEIPQKDVK